MSYTYLSYGQTLFLEGDVGTTFYIKLQGRVSIHKRILVQDEFQDKELIQLQDGKAFGELALENNEPRSASVKAILPTHLAVLEAEDYMVLQNKNKKLISFLVLEYIIIYINQAFNLLKCLIICQNYNNQNTVVFI